MKTGKEIYLEIEEYRHGLLKGDDKTELKKLYSQKYYTYDEIIRALCFLLKLANEKQRKIMKSKIK